MKRTRAAALLLTAALLPGPLSGCGAQPERPAGGVSADAGREDAAQGGNGSAAAPSVQAASTYEEIQAALLAVRSPAGGAAGDGMEEDAVETPSEDGGSPDGSYSGTNVQVEGVDEADLVKTDGEYLYLLREGEITILRAAGAQTAAVGSIALNAEGSTENGYTESVGLYLDGDVLGVVRQQYAWSVYDEASGGYVGRDLSRTRLLLYDVSDPAAPRLTGDLGQDGTYVDSRMVDGVVYLVSSYYVYDLDEPDSYIPRVTDGGDDRLLPADRVYLCPTPDSASYSVVTSAALSGGRRLSEQAVLGAAGGCYMSRESLYLYGGSYVQETSEPRTEDQYTVVDHTDRTATTLLRFELTDGAAVLGAAGQVSGSLLNQFSLDEYDGCLRVAVTNRDWSYQTYTDEKYGFVNYRYPEEGTQSGNSLYVLDASLQTVGALEGFGLDERIYAVRFLGGAGYVVTFRETDPLFALDLSDPQHPALLSELKLTGFSSYLHPYGEGLLVGVGMEADPETGAVSGLKVSMFDVSDPSAVTVLDTADPGDGWSNLLYDHKAALIDPARDLIAFPGDGRYLIYGFDRGSGLTQRAVLEDAAYSSNLRGVRIGGTLYVCTFGGVIAVDLQTMEETGRVDLAFG